jgi:hypothetical protein
MPQSATSFVGKRILSYAPGFPPAGIRLNNLSINGVTAFINKTEYITPSGYSPTILINIVIEPTPIPKSHIPLRVRGAVTGSVAIKNVPINNPPLHKCINGEAYASGFIKYAIVPKTNAESITANGIWKLIVRLIRR